MSAHKFSTKQNWPAIAMLALIAVCSFFFAFDMPQIGDDMRHSYFVNHTFPHLWQWPWLAHYYWTFINSRMGDMIGVNLLAHCPNWMLSLMNAIMETAFYYLTIRWCGLKLRQCVPCMLVIAVLMLLMPWWDSLFLFVCRFNYLWASTLMLVTLGLIFTQRGRRLSQGWLLLPSLLLAAIAGWMHESCGAPVAGALIVYFIYNYRRGLRPLPWYTRLIALAVIAGGAMSVTSPMSWARAASVSEPDASLPVLLAVSCPLALILVGAVAVMLCFNHGRRRIAVLTKSPWAVFVMASIGSIVFIVVGGIIGRSGWFSQTFALIALARLVPSRIFSSIRFNSPAALTAAACLALILAAHLIGVTILQSQANRHLSAAIQLYTDSPDGAVYYRAVHRNEYPAWTLLKNKAEIDADDYWLIETLELCCSENRKPYRLLPPELHGYTPSKPVSLSEGRVEDTLPADLPDSYTAIPFTGADSATHYYISPRIIDPGEK